MSKTESWYREDEKGRRIATRDCTVVTLREYVRRGVVRIDSPPRTKREGKESITFRSSGPRGVLPPGTKFDVVKGEYVPKFCELAESPAGREAETSARTKRESTEGFAEPPTSRKGGKNVALEEAASEPPASENKAKEAK